MALVHLRVVCPAQRRGPVLALLGERVGVVAVTHDDSSDGAVLSADVAREAVDGLLTALTDLGVLDDGMVTVEPLDTALGALARKAEDDAPGEAADALVWDELTSRTGEESTLTWTLLAFMLLATVLAGIGVVTDSTVTIVGAMVVGPEFGPLAGVAVGIVRRRASVARRAGIALVVGFAVALVGTAVLALLGRAAGLFTVADVAQHRQTDFIYSPGWFSLITALVAGAAGMLSLTSSKSAALVGVFISVTTIPAAGNAAVGAVTGQWHQAGESLLQLAINLVGIVAAGVATLTVMSRIMSRIRSRAGRAA